MCKVSIIIPAYNAEAQIEKTIQSVLKQKFRDYEVIVVDDCSSDLTRSIVKKHVEKDGRIRLVSNDENRGVAASRNIGIRSAKGQYIALLDSDDIWHPEYLSRQIELAEGCGDLALLGSNFDFIDHEDNVYQTPELVRSRKRRREHLVEHFTEDIWKGLPYLPSSWISPRERLLEVGIFNERLSVCEDHELALKLSMHGRVLESSDVLMYYRRHSTQLTSQGSRLLEFRAIALESFIKKYPVAVERIGKGGGKKTFGSAIS
jgi:teichuronic acid biosynthesis glycosyltransferase TuaG